jgi:hypothetical protein
MDSKIASKLWERVPQGARENRPDPRDLTNIPTKDPLAALQFSQSLARMIAGFSPAINTRQHQIASGIRTAVIVPEHQSDLFCRYCTVRIIIIDFAFNPLS